MTSVYLKAGQDLDETVEAQWSSFLRSRRAIWPEELNVLPLIDVSHSMVVGDPSPLSIAISLGMTFSLLNQSPAFKGKFITFHETPQMLVIPNGSLHDQVKYITGTPWGGSTNFQRAFDLILDTATLFEVPPEAMPKIFIVLSDMQFNHADNKTNWESIEEKYEQAGYTRPTIIFWNLNGTIIDYPIPSATVSNCALLSGFSDNIANCILNGTIPNPLEIVYRTLDDPHYSAIQLAH